MRQRAPAAMARSCRPSSRKTASIISKRRSSAWPAGTRPIRMPSNGSIFRDRVGLPTRCAARWGNRMGRYVFKLPDIGEGTAEAEIVAWHVKVGDNIEEDAHLVDVMTDKATVEMTSPVSGKIVSLHGEPGAMAPVGAPLVEFEVEGAGNSAGHKAHAAAPAKSAAPAPTTVQKAPDPEPKVEAPKPALKAAAPVARVSDAKPLASPAVRQRADELGIKLQFVPGSGPAGRISHADLDSYVASDGKGGAAR